MADVFNPGTTRPSQPGVYRVRPIISTLPTTSKFYAWWDGSRWGVNSASIERAQDPRMKAVPAIQQNKEWLPITSS